MILITDAHVSEVNGNHPAFFEMLDALGRSRHDVVFLGDIFDLWIALPGYEDCHHRRFLAWCRKEKRRRGVGFVEGNHEFFVAERRADAFSWCSESCGRRDDKNRLFCHGDLINTLDENYLRFRRIARSRLAKLLLPCVPMGRRILERLKIALKKSNQSFRNYDPTRELERFSDHHFSQGVEKIFTGHFHFERTMVHASRKRLHILPDWLTTQKVTLCDEATGNLSSDHWSRIPEMVRINGVLRDSPSEFHL